MMPALCAGGRRFVSAPEPRVVWALEATGRRLRGASTCLVKALVAEMLLGSIDRPLHVTIGVRRSGARLESHAWVERDGRVILGDVRRGAADPGASFAPMLTWESPGA